MNNILKRHSPTSRKVEGSLEVVKILKLYTEIQPKTSEISMIWKGKLAHLPLSYILRFQNEKCVSLYKNATQMKELSQI